MLCLQESKDPCSAEATGRRFAKEFRKQKAIMGSLTKLHGMYNAIIPDELLHDTGVFKERLSQSALYAAMRTVPESEARAVYDWLLARGMKFQLVRTKLRN